MEEQLKYIYKGKIYDGHIWIYGELWRYVGTDTFKIVELEVEQYGEIKSRSHM